MNNHKQVFKSIFGAAWNNLPLAFQKRYMNRPFSNDITTVEGKMDIYFSKLMSWFMPIFRLCHVLVPYQGKDVPVKVDFRSELNSAAIYLDRKFYFADKKPFEFNSRMEVINENDVVERMFLGIGWRMHYFYDGNKIIMQHKSYIVRLFGLNIRLPLEIFLGKGHAEEEVIDDNTYRVTMTMTHPLFGLMYSYSGNFSFTRLPT